MFPPSPEATTGADFENEYAGMPKVPALSNVMPAAHFGEDPGSAMRAALQSEAQPVRTGARQTKRLSFASLRIDQVVGNRFRLALPHDDPISASVSVRIAVVAAREHDALIRPNREIAATFADAQEFGNAAQR